VKRGFIGLDILGMTFLIISVLNILSFRMTMTYEMSGWRLTRVAMTHAHLMASEYEQDEIGVVDPGSLDELESLGYVVTAALYDPDSEELVYGDGWAEPHLENFLDGVFAGQGPEVPKYTAGLGMPRGAMGYQNYTDAGVYFEIAEYALPVVYGGDNRYGVLMVFISSEPQDEQVEKYRALYVDSLKIMGGELEKSEGGDSWVEVV
jgi:hypothetical protein